MQQYPASTSALQTSPPPLDDRESTLSLTVSADVFDSWNEAAMQCGMLLREWAIDGLNQWAETQKKEPGEE